jgi:hypothetical protein
MASPWNRKFYATGEESDTSLDTQEIDNLVQSFASSEPTKIRKGKAEETPEGPPSSIKKEKESLGGSTSSIPSMIRIDDDDEGEEEEEERIEDIPRSRAETEKKSPFPSMETSGMTKEERRVYDQFLKYMQSIPGETPATSGSAGPYVRDRPNARPPGELRYNPMQSVASTAYPVDRSDVEELRGWMHRDNQIMNEIQEDPYYKFAVSVAVKLKHDPEHFVRGEYKEYMRYYGKLHDTPLGNIEKLTGMIHTILPSANRIYDAETHPPRDEIGAGMTESMRRELVVSIQFMKDRQKLLMTLKSLQHSSSYRGPKLMTAELVAMAEDAQNSVHLMSKSSNPWHNASVNDFVEHDVVRNLFSELIAVNNNYLGAINADRPRLEVEYNRILIARNRIIHRILRVPRSMVPSRYMDSTSRQRQVYIPPPPPMLR